MKSNKPIASVSLDLDNKWSYLKTHGDPGWESYPSYLPTVVPRILRFLEERGLTITVFVVGQDAALPANRGAIHAIAEAGHEIGNHSFKHEPWLHLYSEQEIETDLALAEEHIEHVTGQRPRGFRGPGFSFSPTTLQVLARRGYLYDASTFPTFIGPLARTYYFLTARLTAEEKRCRGALFGTWQDGLRSLHPYRWDTGAGALVEIPVTTLPLLRSPIHVSYLLYLSVFSPWLARWYWQTALWLCRATGTPLSLLLHPLDFLGCDDLQDLAFFPGMCLTSETKLTRVSQFLDSLLCRFHVVTMKDMARQVAERDDLKTVRSGATPSKPRPSLVRA